MTPTLPFADLERAYEAIAHAIDRAGPEKEAVFLAKLVLTLAHKMGDIDTFIDAIAIASQNLSDDDLAAGCDAEDVAAGRPTTP
jgi:Protein of unknown function (DUF2783)